MAVEQPKKLAGGAFGRFLAEMRPKLMEECKGKPVTAVTKLASDRFKALSAPDRAIWDQKYTQAKEKYEKDLAAFVAGGGEMKERKRKGDKDDKKAAKKLKKLNKDPDAPKRPAGGGYGCYMDKHRQALMAECKGQPITATSKLAGDRWKKLSEAEKKPFEDAYQAKKQAYENAMKTYVPPEVPEQEDAGQDTEKKGKNADKKEAKETAKKAKAAAKAEKETAKEEKKAAKADLKKAKAAPKAKKGSAPVVSLPPNVLEKAEKAGLKDTLVKLAARADIKESGKSEMQLLKALQDNGGLLHAAKRALLGC